MVQRYYKNIKAFATLVSNASHWTGLIASGVLRRKDLGSPRPGCLREIPGFPIRWEPAIPSSSCGGWPAEHW